MPFERSGMEGNKVDWYYSSNKPEAMHSLLRAF